jgi:hypothetical protein
VVTHPTVRGHIDSYFNSAQELKKDASLAATQKEELKAKQYTTAFPDMPAASFFGFGLDSYGAWGKRAEEFVGMLAELAPVGGRGGRPMSNGEETAARGMIKRQLVECVATALAVGQARFVRTTQNKCVAEAARVAAARGHDADTCLPSQRTGRAETVLGSSGRNQSGNSAIADWCRHPRGDGS